MSHSTSRFLSGLVVLSILLGVLAACATPTPEVGRDLATSTPGLAATRDAAATATAEPGPNVGQTTPLATAQPEAEWLVLLYLDADDRVLEDDILFDLNEAERVGSTDDVTIIAQIDRCDCGIRRASDWTTTKRFFVTQDDDLHKLASTELADLGETNMSDADNLVDFVAWATANYPARKVALILSDHGAGWPGVFSDNDHAGQEDDEQVYLSERYGDTIWLNELDAALGALRDSTGQDKLEFIGFDACLMAQIEVLTMLAPHARYAVASEESEPSMGWAYTAFLTQLVEDPAMDGAGLGEAVVDAYIAQDLRITDDDAREEFFPRYDPSEMDLETLIDEAMYDTTLTAFDLSAVADVNTALDGLTVAMADVDQETIAEARAYAQSYTQVFDQDLPSGYIDLGHFTQWLSEEGGSDEVSGAADELLPAIAQAVLAEKHGEGLPGSTGIAIYFPVLEQYETGPNMGYEETADRFVAESQWDEFLADHYAEDTAADAEPIEIAPLTLSAEVVTPDEPVNITSEVTGDRIGFIYTFIGRILPDENALLVEDIDFVFADETQEIDGVPYPVWPEDGVALEYDWGATVYAINDGTTSVRALTTPDTYGVVPTYATPGTYVFADSGDAVDATLYFRGGVLASVFGLDDADDAAAPTEITPAPGDQFIVRETGFTLDENNEPAEDFSREGGTLTFGDAPLTLETISAPSGSYVVGFIVEDLDGNATSQFESLFVENEASTTVEGFSPYTNEDIEFALLYPDPWTVEEDATSATVTFSSEEVPGTFALVTRDSYPDAADADEANQQAIDDVIDGLNAGGLEDLEYVTDVQNYILGAYPAKTIDFRFTIDGQAFYGSVIVATPAPEATFAFAMIAFEDDYETALTDNFLPMIESFDILISGVEQ